uniref:Uncharacterized protein n=1 Tax=Arion vulgaris TaxID=1028688 RepID=A0A0B6YYD3_9EUPU
MLNKQYNIASMVLQLSDYGSFINWLCPQLTLHPHDIKITSKQLGHIHNEGMHIVLGCTRDTSNMFSLLSRCSRYSIAQAKEYTGNCGLDTSTTQEY